MAMSKVVMMEVMATHMDGDMMIQPTIMTITKPCIKKAMRLDMMMDFILANQNTKRMREKKTIRLITHI